jgi:hypothetical protein
MRRSPRRERTDALFVGPDAFFNTRRVQLASVADMYRPVGVYNGNIRAAARRRPLLPQASWILWFFSGNERMRWPVALT